MTTTSNSTGTSTTSTTEPRTSPSGRRFPRLVACVAFAAVGVGIAAAGTAAAETPSVGPRLEAACKRVPNLQLRNDRLLTRLNGDVQTRGSLAWLQAELDRAEGSNRPQLVTVLENRLAVRTARLAVLQRQQESLIDIAAICADHGIDT